MKITDAKYEQEFSPYVTHSLYHKYVGTYEWGEFSDGRFFKSFEGSGNNLGRSSGECWSGEVEVDFIPEDEYILWRRGTDVMAERKSQHDWDTKNPAIWKLEDGRWKRV